MKKLFAIILVLMMLCIPGKIFSQGKLPVKLGLKIAPNIGWMSPRTKDYSSDGARFGGTIGFVSDIYFAENYALSTGLNFQFINGKLTYPDSLLIESTQKVVPGQVYSKYHFIYLEIPLMIKMKTKTFGKISYFGQVGFGTGFRLSATINEHFVPKLDPSNPIDQQFDSKKGTTLIRESILFGIGCEYHLDESSRILIGFTYSNSLNNVLNGNNYSNQIEKSLLNYAELNLGFLF